MGQKRESVLLDNAPSRLKYELPNIYKNIRLQDKDQYRSFETGLRAQLSHLSENREFFAAALRCHGQNSLSDYMVETNEEYITECWQAAHGKAPDSRVASAVAFSAAGFSYLLKRWVLNDCAEDPSSVVAVICDCIPSAILETLY